MRLTTVVPLLGIAQIISWGTLYYTIGVVGPLMREAAGVSELFLFTCFTLSLLISGLAAPAIGRMIDRRGGRLALSAGSLAAAAALVVLASAQGPISLVIGWSLAGAAMAATLYDPAFATLNQLTHEHYRRAVTALTLFGGFASTVFWPLTHALMAPLGWRGTLLLYAALHLLICLPIHAWALRRAHSKMLAAGEPPTADNNAAHAAPAPASGSRTFLWLALSFIAASFVVSVVGVHMISLLTTSGLSTRDAVLIGMLMGPMQVAGRLVEMGFLSRVKAAHVGLGAFALLALGVVCLFLADGSMAMAIAFVAAYGCGNGILTIVRGTAPAELIGRAGLGALLGRLSRGAMISKAVAPAAFTALLAAGFARDLVIALLALAAALAWAAFMQASRSAVETRKPVTIS